MMVAFYVARASSRYSLEERVITSKQHTFRTGCLQQQILVVFHSSGNLPTSSALTFPFNLEQPTEILFAFFKYHFFNYEFFKLNFFTFVFYF